MVKYQHGSIKQDYAKYLVDMKCFFHCRLICLQETVWTVSVYIIKHFTSLIYRGQQATPVNCCIIASEPTRKRLTVTVEN